MRRIGMGTTKLIEKIKQHDQAAFEELYNEYYPMGFSLALQFVKNEEEAMDVMQDAFVTVCTKLDSLQDTNKFKSWYMQIVANKCRDFLKKKNPVSFTDANIYDEDGNLQFDIEDDDREFQPEELVDYSETVRIVNEMLDELPEDQKMCLILYYVNGLKISEIAESLGVSEATVKSRLKYGKEKLKVQVEDYEKKTGTKLHSFAGFALIPFVKWMFNNKANNNVVPNTETLRYCLNNLGKGVCNTINNGVFNMNEKNPPLETSQNVNTTTQKINFGKLLKKFNSLNMTQKVISLIAAGAVMIGGVIGITSINGDNNQATNNGIFASKREMIYLDNYLTITFNGQNKKGYASYDFDYESTNGVVGKTKIDEYLIEVMGEEGRIEAALGEHDSFADLLEFKFENNKELCNGDTVIFNISLWERLIECGSTLEDYKDFLGIEFSDSYVYTVNGLPEYQEVGVLKEAAKYITFSGGNGGATASINLPEDFQYKIGEIYFVRGTGLFSENYIKVIKDNSVIGEFEIGFKNNENLSNNDSLTACVNSSFDSSQAQAELHKLGYHLSQESYVLTVSGLGEYIKSNSNLSVETLEKIKSSAQAQLDKGTKIISYYIATLKPTVEGKKTDKLVIKIIHKERLLLTDYYGSGTIKEIVLNADGSITCSLSLGGAYSEKPEKEEEKLKEKYIIEKIG